MTETKRKPRSLLERWSEDTVEYTPAGGSKKKELEKPKKPESKADAAKATPAEKLMALTNDKGKIPCEMVFGRPKDEKFDQDDPPSYKLPWEVKAVAVKGLIPTQKNVESEKINHMLNRIHKKFEYPLILKDGEKLYILDGHHRLTTEWLEGNDVVDVEMADCLEQVRSDEATLMEESPKTHYTEHNEGNALTAKADAIATVGAPEAAGILFISEGGKILLGLRAEYGNYPLHWGVFGGHREPDEPLEMTARREVLEETGYDVPGVVQSIAQTFHEGVSFTYFMCVCERFDPILNFEHVDSGWFAMGELPAPMHPGIDGVLALPEVMAARKRKMNETDVAKAMALGALPSPQRFANMSMYRMRITGTGTAFRKGYVDKETGKRYKDEHVFRRPENYLTSEFLDRCQGLPLIWEHPDDKVLDSDEFHDRMIGVMVCPYIQGDEVWGIAKVYDDAAIVLLDSEKMSTSPAVVFQDTTVNSTIPLNDGSQLLIEGNPSLLDHLAVCEIGVWDKQGPAAGVESETVIADSVTKPDGV